MSTTPPSIAYVVPHTHWDREWRYPLWKNRMLLVEMMDRLLETLDQQPEYRNFVLDGQCVAIEDYLEIRPEQAARVAGTWRPDGSRSAPGTPCPTSIRSTRNASCGTC